MEAAAVLKTIVLYSIVYICMILHIYFMAITRER